jgi:hypothetical protein
MVATSEPETVERRERHSTLRCPLDDINDVLEGVVQNVLKKVLGTLARIEKQNAQLLARIGAPQGPKRLTAEQVAEQFDRSVWTVCQLCRFGLINAVKGNDGRWRISADEVARLAETGMPKLPPKNDVKGSSMDC